jgi:hypothetical protein
MFSEYSNASITGSECNPTLKRTSGISFDRNFSAGGYSELSQR